jgi:CheY-like chemotaxis protein
VRDFSFPGRNSPSEAQGSLPLAMTADVPRAERPEKTRILVVEDSDDHSELLLRQLRKSHLDGHVKIVRDGLEAWHFLDRQCRVSELIAVFLDLHIPSLDGIVLLRKIREHPRLKPVSVVVISSSDDPADRVECLRLGVSSFVSKPVSFANFSKTVANVFHSSESRRLDGAT